MKDKEQGNPNFDQGIDKKNVSLNMMNYVANNFNLNSKVTTVISGYGQSGKCKVL